MNEKQKSQLIAEAENVEAIRDFFNYWYSVEQLYETLAKSCTTILHMVNKSQLPDEDKKQFEELVNQHEMMIDLIKPFAERKEEEV